MELIALHEALFVPCKNLLFNCIVQLLKPALLHGTLDDGQMVGARVFLHGAQNGHSIIAIVYHAAQLHAKIDCMVHWHL